MRSGKGKRVAFLVAGLVTVIVAACASASWRSIAERWYLRQIETGEAAGKMVAVEKLGRMRSLRAVPALARIIEDADDGLKLRILEASRSIGVKAVPVVLHVLRESSDMGMARLAAVTLTEMGPAELVGERVRDPIPRKLYAFALAEKGLYPEALKEYLWCFDHRAEHSQGFSADWLDVLLRDMFRLGRLYPPAMRALEERRDQAAERIFAGASRGMVLDVLDFTRLNQGLGDPSSTLSLAARLKGLEDTANLRDRLLRHAIDGLLQAGRYAEVIDSAPDYEAGDAVQDACRFYQALLGAGQVERASALARRLLARFPSGDTFAALACHSALAGENDQCPELLEQARTTFSDGDFPAVREAIINGMTRGRLDRNSRGRR